ncbi:MAG: hypothetical protein QOI36_6661 [Pseudonocardiales bacterium]|jgi:hypothetical protein|nr:hypothetical protein [Pseudonocardiales bacterium]MDX6293029.1 hypothetical protein [Kribbellaceae bacterium]
MPSQYQPHQRFTEADRDKIAGRLRDAFADGRLDQTEFTSRLDQLYAVTTYGELEPLVRDLPPVRTYQTPAMVQNTTPTPDPGTFPERTRNKQPRLRRGLAGGFGGIVMMNIVIWAVIGIANGGHWPAFWPAWLLIPWGFIMLGSRGRRR